MDKYLVVGTGGIGSALIRNLLADGKEVCAINRTPDQDLACHIYSIEETEAAIDSFKPNNIIVCTGLLQTSSHRPEKNVTEFSSEWFNANLEANLLPSVRVAQHVSKMLDKSSNLKMLCLSARVSSITDNKLGGWYSYRMSKCALNMFIKNLSIEWKRKSPNAIAATYHPGTVYTDLSKEYVSGPEEGKVWTPEHAAKLLLENLDALTPERSGDLIDWRGDTIEY
jgi:NAD(P)-dependent dehydrogenase (short-subunit alcohol dehydrogenase family)